VIVLPNNKNVIPAANQAAELAKKTVRVLPTRSIPQGLSAMVCFNREAGLDKNLVEMSRCQEQVKSIEITTAVRDAQVNELQIKKGNYIGLINGDIKVACESSDQVVFRSLELVDAGNAGIVTLFYGNHVGDGEATELRNSLKEKYPGLDIELIRGSQPHYSYIISVE
jgi:dihydroxyacetone kinase-like predicted kinase